MSYDPDQRITRKHAAVLARTTEKTLLRDERDRGLQRQDDPQTKQATYRLGDLVESGRIRLEDVTLAGNAAEAAEVIKSREHVAKLAAECVRLRCPHLRAEATLAAQENGSALFDPLVALLPTATEPGTAGTLLGAVAALITAAGPGADPPASVPALAHTRALRWWAKIRPQVEASVPCERSGSRSCPDCWEGHGCPRDTLYQPVTRVAVLGERGRLTKKGINDRLFGSRPDRRINAWPGTHPREAAYMAWLVFTFTTQEDRVLAANDYLAVAMAKDLHLLEPRLARVACQTLAESRGLAAARVLAEKVLATRSTDPAYDELALWMTWHEQAAVQAARRQAPRTITHPRLARPAGRVNHNPYLPR